MYIYISTRSLLLAIPVAFTVISLIVSSFARDGINAMWWFMAMMFGIGASVSSLVWYWMLLLK